MSTPEIKKNSVSQSRVPTEVGYDRGDTLFNDSISKKSANVNPGNKKETDTWFQALGQPVPTGGTKYGFIRSIRLNFENVKTYAWMRKTSGNRYYTHRIIMPDGSSFIFEPKKVEPTSSDILTTQRDKQGTDIGSTKSSISKKFANVNPGNKKEQCITVPSSHGSGVRQGGYTAQ